ncbi:hypothetical protein [Flavobacterium anhuiense]|uniref:hypothetical protein n=1 Tax=Flavobacterium anhuiense TaxID=459526 RepID=UPI0020271BBA|nr:hypothetical protein [Flavobacterium anhuiense]URM37127.1 hypothetical protein LLY39_00610 [Flavobacterium anhuiense]
MQINLHHDAIKEFLKYLGWILLIIAIWLKACKRETVTSKNQIVKIPEAKAVFETQKPEQKPIILTQKSKPVYLNNPINERLLEENEKLKSDYSKMSDSLKSRAFDKAIELNQFSSKFEDENMLLNINGTVRGEVLGITPSYIIKAKEIPIQIKEKQTVFRLLGGLELGNNLQLNSFKAKGNLMFQNRKGNIISGSFDTNQTVWIGYNASIFEVKR